MGIAEATFQARASHYSNDNDGDGGGGQVCHDIPIGWKRFLRSSAATAAESQRDAQLGGVHW